MNGTMFHLRAAWKFFPPSLGYAAPWKADDRRLSSHRAGGLSSVVMRAEAVRRELQQLDRW